MSTIKEIATACGVSEQAIRGWCRRNHVAKDERNAYVIDESTESSIYRHYKLNNVAKPSRIFDDYRACEVRHYKRKK